MTTSSPLWTVLAPGVRAIDRRLRGRLGIHEFTDDPQCLFRIQFRQADRIITLPDGDVPAGSEVVEFHWWNEHLPQVEDAGSSLAWAATMVRRVRHTHRLLAREALCNPDWASVRAIGGITAMFAAVPGTLWERRLARVGYVIAPHAQPKGAARDYWERVWAWALWHSYQVGTRRVLRPGEIALSELWMSKRELLHRFGEALGEEAEADDDA